MNEIVNKLLLAGDRFMPEMHLRQPGLTYSCCGPFTKKARKEHKNLKKQEIQDIYTEMSLTKLFFIIWLMEIIKIYQEDQLQIKYYLIKHLIL